MSIDLDIFPTTSEIAFWGNIKHNFKELLTSEEINLLGEHPNLLHLGTKHALADEESLSLDNSYYLSLAIPNTLSINVMQNQGNLDELEYLEDYGRNLDHTTIHMLAERWRKAGYSYEVTSMAGRSKPEPRLFVALATAIAYACVGYVIVMNNGIFNLSVGIYTPEQFQYAQPQF